jgi:hypothetical protein
MAMIGLVVNETEARAYPQQGHGNEKADPKVVSDVSTRGTDLRFS